jgi:hypothetical protein
MKIRNVKKKRADELPPANPVAKFAHRFNKAGFFTDTRSYSRKRKHAGKEDWLSVFLRNA